MSELKGRTLVLGVTGGVAAYKAAELVRLLGKAGAGWVKRHTKRTLASKKIVTPNHLCHENNFSLNGESDKFVM